MKKLLVALLVASFVLVSCSSHMHKVGAGAKGDTVEEARQWYVLFGLVPLNDVDTNKMAGDAKDYTIETNQSGLDTVINMFTGTVSVYSRTVTVKK